LSNKSKTEIELYLNENVEELEDTISRLDYEGLAQDKMDDIIF
jgi:hypothetical protein